MLICQVQGILMERDSIAAQQSFSSLGGSLNGSTQSCSYSSARLVGIGALPAQIVEPRQRRPSTLVAASGLYGLYFWPVNRAEDHLVAQSEQQAAASLLSGVGGLPRLGLAQIGPDPKTI
jgi:hypothetical protein